MKIPKSDAASFLLKYGIYFLFLLKNNRNKTYFISNIGNTIPKNACKIYSFSLMLKALKCRSLKFLFFSVQIYAL